ncbi:MAG: hypothetical protein R3D00_00010 [Bacteroidia bacterium]
MKSAKVYLNREVIYKSDNLSERKFTFTVEVNPLSPENKTNNFAQTIRLRANSLPIPLDITNEEMQRIAKKESQNGIVNILKVGDIVTLLIE